MAQFPQYLPVCRHACRSLGEGFGSAPAWLQNRSSPKVVECRNLALASGLCQAVGMAKKRTKADRLERQTEQLGKRADRHPDEIEKKKATREDVNQVAAQTR